jgi:hypothetical protein
MPVPQYFDIDPTDVDVDGIAEAQTTDGAGNLVLDGELADLGTAGQFDIGDSYPAGIGGVKIAIDSAGDVSGITFTVTGKDQDGNDITEDITGVTTTEVQSDNYWSQITQIAADGEVTSTVTVGTVDEVITAAYPLNWRDREPTTVAVYNVVGTIDYDVDNSFDPPGTPTAGWFVTSLDGETTAQSGSLTLHARLVRLKVNSYTSGASLRFAVLSN